MRIALVSPGMLPVLGKSRSSVEIAISEVAWRMAGRHSVEVYGRSRHGGTVSLPSGPVVHNYRGPDYRRWLVRKLRASKPDVVQVENRPLLAAALRRSLPRSTVVTLGLHSITYIAPGANGRGRVRRALRAADAVIVNSGGLARYVRSIYPGACRRLPRVYLGVNLGAFRPASSAAGAAMRRTLRAKLGIPHETKMILFVGRLIPQKGVHHLIAALPRVRRVFADARVVVVGGARCGGSAGTPYVRRLIRMARRTRGAMLAGYIPHQVLPAYYAAADVVVTPSVRHEALCLVNLEAMAAGLPVVSCRIGGIPEVVVHRQTGLLVSPGRVRQELAPAINEALAGAARLGANGHERARSLFSWDRTAVEYERIYAALGHFTGRAEGGDSRIPDDAPAGDTEAPPPEPAAGQKSATAADRGPAMMQGRHL